MTDLAARVLAAINTTMLFAERLDEYASGHDRPYNPEDPTDPAVVIRHCLADRRTVERHSLRGKSVLRNGEFVDYCADCVKPIPCPDLTDRAVAYGVLP